MQELLEWTRRTLPMDLDTPRMIEAKIQSLLVKEKEQIKNAYDDGVEYEISIYSTMDSEDYYKKTYANDTTKGLPKEDSKRRGWHY